MAELFTLPFVQALDSDANPIAGAKLTFYRTGTTTLATVYADDALTTPLSNPVVADSAGRFASIYLDQTVTYRVRLFTAGDVLIADVDPYNGGDSGMTLYDAGFGVKADGTTDDAAATNAFLAALTVRGGVGFMKPGPRLFGSQVFIDRNQPNSVKILGYGVKIKTTHAGSAFKIQNGYDFYATEICGLNVNETANASALCAFEQTRTTNVTWRNCYVNSDAGVVNASYGGFFLHNSVPSDPDTGCFWTAFPGSGVRRGGSGEFNYGVRLQGAANATWFDGIKITGVIDAIKIQAETGQGYLSNAVFVTGAAIEGVSGHALRIIGGGAATTCPGGIVIDNSRFESVTGSVLSIEGCTLSAPRWPMVTLSAIDTTVSAAVNLVNNPNSLRYDLSYKDADRTERAISVVAGGQTIESVTATNDVLELRAANIGSGLSIGEADGNPLHVWLRRVTSDVVELAANVAQGFGLSLAGVRGISGTATRANNLRGVATFTAATAVNVTFGTAETNATYFVLISQSATSTSPPWITAKGMGGFTINFSAAFTGTVDWLLVR